MQEIKEQAQRLVEFLKLRCDPVGVSYLKSEEELPEKVKRPKGRKVKITICQGVGWVKIYGWQVAIAKDDNLCLPAGLAFGFLKSKKYQTEDALSELMLEVGWVKKEALHDQEWFIIKDSFEYLLLEPLKKATKKPDVVLIYGNAAQIVKLIHGYSYHTGKGVKAKITGRLSCTESLIAPFLTNEPIVTLPGTGERIFSATQENELCFSVPYSLFDTVVSSLSEAGAKIGGNRYPFTSYLLYQPVFPVIYQDFTQKMQIE